MSVADPLLDLLSTLTTLGVDLRYEGDRLRFRAPKGAVTAELRERVIGQRAAVIAALRARAMLQVEDQPLSLTQSGIWFQQQQVPASSVFCLGFGLQATGPLDIEAVRHAMQALVDRHAALRTTFAVAGDQLVQRVSGAATAILDLHDISGLDAAAIRSRIDADLARPFDLVAGPLFRAGVFADGAGTHVVLLAMHHIVADFWTVRLLSEEFLRLYAEASTGEPSGLAPSEHGYETFVQWQARLIEGASGERLWTYWRGVLADLPPRMTFAGGPPRPAMPSFRGGHVSFSLPNALTRQIRALAAQNGCTSFVILLAAFQLLLARLSGTADIVTGVPVLGRPTAAFLSMVGCFANALPIRSRLDAAATLPSFLSTLRETMVNGLEAQDYPASLMVRRLQPSRESTAQPLFNTFFTMVDMDGSQANGGPGAATGAVSAHTFAGVQFAVYPPVCQQGLFDLALDMAENASELGGHLKYTTDQFEEKAISDIAKQYIGMLETMTGAPHQMMSALIRDPADIAAERLLADLAARDVQLLLEDDRLRVNAPKGAIDDAAKAAITSLRSSIIARLAAARIDATQATIPRVPRDGVLPLSSAQRRLWLLDRIQPGAVDYNLGFAARLRGRLDLAALAGAVDLVVERHEALRMAISERDGGPCLRILPPGAVSLECRTTPDEAAAIEAAVALHQRPFDMAGGPLARVALISIGETLHLLVGSVHHVVTDGWSNGILNRELFEAYEALSAGRAPDLPPLPVGYPDYAAWESEQLRSARAADVLSFWRAELEGAPPLLALPVDRPRRAPPSAAGGRVSRLVPDAFLDRLKATAQSHRATLFMLLLAAWQAMLHRYSGQEDLVIGTPVANRELSILEGVVGCFVNAIPLRSRLSGNPEFRVFLEQTRKVAIAAFDHRDIPFDRLVEAINPDRAAGHAPIYQVHFNLLSFPLDLPAVTTLKIEPVELPTGSAKLDLSLDIVPVRLGEHAGSHQFLYEFDCELFDPQTIERLHDNFMTLLHAVVENPACPVLDLDMLSDAERQHPAHLCGAAMQPPPAVCAHQFLEASARRHPERIAISGPGGALRYDQLETRANRLARYLVQRGVRPGALVAVCVERSVDIPVALAAVMKAGAAYVPLDPSHPEARLRYIVQDAGAECVITQSGLEGVAGGTAAHVVRLDADAAAIATCADTPLDIAVRPDDLAYVIYTSGSTGRPKGVEVEHRNLVAFLDAMQQRPGLHADDVLLAVTTISFDIAGLEIWLPIMAGARIVLATRAEAVDATRLAAMLAEHEISVLQATPATWRLLLASGWTGRPGLRALCGGEAMPADVAAQLMGRVGALWNMYGPTETTIWSTTSAVVDAAAPIAIGRPIVNTTVHVVDGADRPVPVGVAGELLIGGAGVARGYRHRPDLTAKAFVTLETDDGPQRVYRTGDIVRFRQDGELEYLGRRDHQVKLRGYRIELGEIEAVLTAQPGVSGGVVIPQATAPGDERLVGYVTLAPDADFAPEDARAAMRTTLPDYMIPSHIIVLPSFPLTPNGKVDRTALPAPEQATATPSRIPVGAMAPDQQRVARVWMDVLRLDRVGLHQNFFDLGGHSLLLIRLQGGLAREFGFEIPLVELFQRTTVAQQADRMSAAPTSGVSALQRARARAERQLHV